MKKLFLLLFASIIVFSVYCQPQKGYVYLKNGSILKGKYQYNNDLSKVQVESAGNRWIFHSDEVEKVTGRKPETGKKNETREFNPKFGLHTELGILAGNSGNSQTAPFSFSSALNYSILPKLSAGAGIGLEFLKETYLPAFLNVEYKIRNSWSTPYAFLKAGYQVSVEDSHPVYNGVQPYYDYIWPGPDPNNYNQKLDPTGGFLLNTGIGYHQMFSAAFGITFAFGYQFHRLGYSGENDYRLDIDYNRLTIKLGIVFN